MEIRNIKYGALEFNYKFPETYKHFTRYGIKLEYIQLDKWTNGTFNIDMIELTSEKIANLYYLFEYKKEDDIKLAVANVTLYNSSFSIEPLIWYYYADMEKADPSLSQFGRIKRWCPIEVINISEIREDYNG